MIEAVISSSVLITIIILIRSLFKGKIKSSVRYSLWLIAALNVKYLSVTDITDGADMSRIYQMENLEQLLIMGERINTRGIDNLKMLKSLNIMLCSYSDLSGLKKCGSLESLMIYNCETPEFDAKDIEGMTGLKYLDFNCSEIENSESLKTLTGLEDLKLYFCNLSSSELKEIKKALPDCVITLDDGSTVS